MEVGTGNSGYVIVDVRELTTTEAEEAIAEAERQVGRNGKVIVLQYKDKGID